MYYNIEVINNLNMEFIVIVINRTQYPTFNDTGILILNSDPDLHFFLTVLSKRKADFEIRSKSNIPSKQTRENYHGTH